MNLGKFMVREQVQTEQETYSELSTAKGETSEVQNRGQVAATRAKGHNEPVGGFPTWFGQRFSSRGVAFGFRTSDFSPFAAESSKMITAVPRSFPLRLSPAAVELSA
jgi:hypothetical protein